MGWIHAYVTPNFIPADGVELLRHLISSPETTEIQLEQWIRQYPQAIGSSPENLQPKRRFYLTSETTVPFEPDILYKEIGESYFDILELKRANFPTTSGSQGLEREIWVPSKPPTFSSQIIKALSQLQFYLRHSENLNEYFRNVHHIQFYMPKGLLIAGNEVGMSSRKALRFLEHMLPNRVRLLTWPGLLRIAERMRPQTVRISLPCLPDEDSSTPPPSSGIDFGFHQEIVASFSEWTGRGAYVNPLQNWKELLSNAYSEAYELQGNLDETHDEERNIASSIEGGVLEKVYYRLGKYCLDKENLKALQSVLPRLDDYISRRSFTRFGERVITGFEDTQNWIRTGAKASSVDELEGLLNKIMRRPHGLPGYDYREDEQYYRQVITMGFLKARTAESDIQQILKAANWIREPEEK